MLTLSLFRHAKSSWADPSLEDFDRPLAPRGQKAAPAMAAFMKGISLRPDLVLCSPSQRTRETLALVAGEIGDPKVTYPEDLYLAEPETLLASVQATKAGIRHLMLVGHNPGLQDFAASLLGSGDAADRRAIAAKLPTAALVVMTFAVKRWRDVAPATGRLEQFMTPKRLP